MEACIRYWPEVGGPPRLLGFPGYKAGMTHAYVVDANEHSVLRGKEIFTPATVLDAPPLFVLGIRGYGMGGAGLKCLAEAWAADVPEEIGRRIGKVKARAPDRLKELAQGIVEVRAIISTLPGRSGSGKKKPEVFEIGIGGGKAQERVDYAIGLLGKEVDASQVLKPGEFVDVFSISKGKGFAGVIKRFGVKIRDRKSNKPRRNVATLGAWNPSAVMSTVPRAGQLGFSQRTERNKYVLAVGNEPAKVNVNGGFIGYGLVPGTHVLLKGSVAGPARRLIKMRVSARRAVQQPTAPTITEIALASPQGG
jgi:large subunit ribosomal protein L3